MLSREDVGLYFSAFPTWTLWVGILGLPLVIPSIVSGYFLWKWLSQPTDAQIDEFIDEELSKLQEHSLTLCGLDETDLVAESVTLTGLRFGNLGGAEVGRKRGKDKVLRFTPMEATIIHFTRHQLVAFQCVLDLRTGRPLNETVDEFFYKHIAAWGLRKKAITIDAARLSPEERGDPAIAALIKDNRLQLNAATQFFLTTSGNVAVEAVIDDATFIHELGGGTISTERADVAIRAVRKMLREKGAA